MRKLLSVEKLLVHGSSNLYIFFGGIAAGIAVPQFEFYNSAQILEENKIFVRDFDQCWYHNGLQNISENIVSSAEYLKQEIEQANNSVKISIFVSRKHGLDYIHAKRLKKFLNAAVIAFEKGEHNIVKLLKVQGHLPSIMRGNINF